MSSGFWLCAAITVVSAVVSLGYSVAAVRGPGRSEPTEALYAFSRSSALAVAAVVVLFVRSEDWLRAVAVAMIIVQAGDAVIGARIGDRLKTVGPALTALANLAALVNLMR